MLQSGSPRILLVSPVRDEAGHITRVARAVAAQTVPPAAWIVVDDGSSDATLAHLNALEPEIPFLSVCSTPPDHTIAATGDRLAAAAAPRAFNFGLTMTDVASFDFIGKLDGDTELPPDYFERLLRRFDADPALGIGGGVRIEHHESGDRELRIPRDHVPGALKLYRRDCFTAIGGIEECLGWDAIDELSARMLGYTTRSFPEIATIHHRAWGEADGALRGRVRYGRSSWIAGQGPVWVTVKAAKVAATLKPRPLSGVAFLYGYWHAVATGVPRFGGPAVRRFVRKEQRARVRRRLRRVSAVHGAG